MKTLKKLGLAAALSALVSSSAFAYITDPLPASTYVTDAGLDWTWASPWGTVFEGVKFAAPGAHAGWRYATTAELEYLFANLVDDFVNGGTPIQSVAYWDLDGSNDHVDIGDLTAGAMWSVVEMAGRQRGVLVRFSARTTEEVRALERAVAFKDTPALPRETRAASAPTSSSLSGVCLERSSATTASQPAMAAAAAWGSPESRSRSASW